MPSNENTNKYPQKTDCSPPFFFFFFLNVWGFNSVAFSLLVFLDDGWHLQKTNWCGEAAEVLDDLELTLEMSLVNHGDHLLLVKGKLPPKVIYHVLGIVDHSWFWLSCLGPLVVMLPKLI